MKTGPQYAGTALLVFILLACAVVSVRAEDKKYLLPFTLPISGMRDPVDLNRVSGLALKVEDAGWPAISMLGHGWGTLGELAQLTAGGGLTPVGFPFGTVRYAEAGQLVDQEVNEVSNTLTFRSGKSESLKVTVTRLSPAILLEASGRELELFGGRDKPAPGGSPASAPEWDSAFPPPLGTVKPLRWATPGADGKVITGVFGNSLVLQFPFKNWEKQRVAAASSPAPLKASVPPVAGLGQTWLLLWYGSGSPFLSSKIPAVLLGRGYGPANPLRMTTVFQADVPLLFVFEKTPQSIVLRQEKSAAAATTAPASGPEGSTTRLVVTFAGPAGKVVMLPLFGHDVQFAETTEKWLKEFPADLQTRCDAWAKRLGDFPVNVKEETAYDEKADRVACTETFEYVKVRPNGEKIALMRPMLALGLQQKLPAVVTPPPVDLKYATQFGPLMAVPGDRYEWHLDGLGKYVAGRPVLGPSNEKSAVLEKELAAEVDKILAAGHLAPWFVYAGWSSIVTTYGKDPSEALYFLSEILPVLSEAQQARVRDYLAKEAAAYPPDQVLQLKATEGARREFSLLPEGLPRKFDGPLGTGKMTDEYYERVPSLFRAYGVARGCLSTERPPTKEVWEFWRSAMRESLTGRDWATLGWFRGKYTIQRGWEPGPPRDAAEYLARYRKLYSQYTPRAVHRDAAGLIGYLRLCRMAGEKGEPEAWGQLARLMTMRFALARYGRYLAESGLFRMIENPAAATNPARSSLVGNMETYARYEDPQAVVAQLLSRSGDFRKPENHFEQVWEVNQHEVTLLSGASKEWKGWLGPSFQSWNDFGYTPYHQIVFFDLTPEVGRILADWGLKDDVARFVRHYAEVQAYWYKAHAENSPLSLQEPAGTLADDSYQYFLAHAWIAETPPEELEQYIDEPWVAIGDYFYLHKLAETIKAYRGVKWEAPAAR